jgi:hypothetical protein
MPVVASTMASHDGALEFLDQQLKDNGMTAWAYVKKHGINPALVMKECKHRIG